MCYKYIKFMFANITFRLDKPWVDVKIDIADIGLPIMYPLSILTITSPMQLQSSLF